MSRAASAIADRRPFADRRRSGDILVTAVHLALTANALHGQSVRALLAAHHEGDEALRAVLERAAVLPASTAGNSWADTLAVTAVADFVASLGNASAGSRLIEAGLRFDMSGANLVLIPGRATAKPAAANVGWTGEGAPIRVRQESLAAAQLGPPKKLTAIATLSGELARGPNGEAVVRQLLREDAAWSLDAAIFSAAPADSTRPAGLLSGVTSLTATSGGGDAAMLADLEKLGSAVASATGVTEVAFVAAPAQALSAQLRLGRLGSDVSVWPSGALLPGVVIAVAPSAFASGFDADPRIESSDQATLHLEDTSPAPLGTPGSPNVVAASTVSLWQGDLLGVRLILRAAWALRAPGAVAWLSAATWG